MIDSFAIPLDRLGRHLQVGDVVVITQIPPTLIAGVPREDQEAILQCVGKSLLIAGFNDLGEAEFEFFDSSNNAHTIWLRNEIH